MQIVLNFKRSTVLKAAAATGLALALAGAVGTAIAMSPIITPPIKWAGGAEFAYNSVNGNLNAYTVPAGRNFILTDLVIGNPGGSQLTYGVRVGNGGSCGSAPFRVANVSVPAGDTSYLNLQTGIGFTSGQTVCVDVSGPMSINGRGFLFTAAPP